MQTDVRIDRHRDRLILAGKGKQTLAEKGRQIQRNTQSETQTDKLKQTDLYEGRYTTINTERGTESGS